MALLAFAFSVMLRYPKNSKNGSFVRVNPQTEMKMTHSSTTYNYNPCSSYFPEILKHSKYLVLVFGQSNPSLALLTRYIWLTTEAGE